MWVRYITESTVLYLQDLDLGSAIIFRIEVSIIGLSVGSVGSKI